MTMLTDGKFLELHATSAVTPRREHTLPPPTPDVGDEREQARRAKRAQRQVQLGELSHAMSTLSSESRLLRLTPDTEAELCAKHPELSRHLPQVPLHAVVALPAFEPKEVIAAMRRMHKGTAGGPSRWRLEHLQVLLNHSHPSTFVRLVHMVAIGSVPEEVRRFVYGAAVTPLTKAKGAGVRPVAVGEILSRIAGKVLARQFSSEFRDFFTAGNQFGVGMPNGMEAAVLAVKLALERRPAGGVVPGRHFQRIQFGVTGPSAGATHSISAVPLSDPLFHGELWFIYAFGLSGFRGRGARAWLQGGGAPG